MYKVYIYRDKDGDEPIAEYMAELAQREDKDSRIKIKKIREYTKILSEYGLQAGEPYVKHIDGDIWELRPLRDRIFFACWLNGSFVLLHHFMKKTQKTPAREIEKAKAELADLLERGVRYD